VDDIIARRKLKSTMQKKDSKKRKRDDDDDGDSEDSESGEEDEESEEEEDNHTASADESDPLDTEDEEDAEVPDAHDDESDAGSSSSEDTESETQAEADRKAAFFADESTPGPTHSSFLTMNLSRPIMKALTSLTFHVPTPIQAATIPVALLGKDVVGGAVTGSGKTAAFVIPMLERLMYRERGKNAAATRCLVLVPTRELAIQCFDVGTKLAAHTDIQFCLIVGD
jgi:ATP-dependent RNA helicase DDX27